MERVSERLINWASAVEPDTLEQARRASELSFVYPHVALMPDAHVGKGVAVGAVIPTKGAVVPAAVGADIGCGMIAVRTQYTATEVQAKDRAALRRSIEQAVPLSAGKYNPSLTASARVRVAESESKARVDYDELAANWRLQLGSLGSGNHFIELTVDELDRLWLFLHSGSRGIGNKIASQHILVAQQQMRDQDVDLPERDLAYLTEGTPEFDAYLRDLDWAQHFALLNREEMMDRVVTEFGQWVGAPVEETERINCHHNFTQREWHSDAEVWVTRKGAIEAGAQLPGLIPGSMGTASYVVRGKANALSLNSAPHGAGRAFSRSAARKRFTPEQLRAAMAGIEYRDTDAFVDEIPQAYKDIDQVMADADDLVEIVHTLRQLVNVKGD